jgi:hypothetical protein
MTSNTFPFNEDEEAAKARALAAAVAQAEDNPASVPHQAVRP